MENMTTIEMLVNQTVADDISRKGLAEIALRRSDARFKAMVKCQVLKNNQLTQETADRLLAETIKLRSTSTESIRRARKEIRTIQSGINSISTSAKKIAINAENIYKDLKPITNITYINAGLSLTNLAVDTVGFMVINKKISMLYDAVQENIRQISRVNNMLKNEKLSMCHNMIMRYRSIFSEVARSINCDRNLIKNVETLLMEMRPFISEMIRNLLDDAMDIEAIHIIINMLLPSYTNLLNLYIKLYFAEYHCKVPNYEDYISLYDEIICANYIERMQDYYIFNRNMHYVDAFDAVSAQQYIAINGKVIAEDQYTLLDVLGSKEKADSFDQKLNEYAMQKAENVIPGISKMLVLDADMYSV